MRNKIRLFLLFAFLVLFAAAIRGQDGACIALPVESLMPGQDTIDYLHDPPQNLSDIEPFHDQDTIGDLLAAVGDNVSKLFANLLNISAVEKVQQQKLVHEGEADPGRKFEYLYLCVGAVDKNNPSFNEYRSDARGHEISQLGLDNGYMLTSGFVSAPLIFHPLHQHESSFRLLGRQKLKGRDTIVVAYAQIPQKSRLSGTFQSGGTVETTFKQGMAWIDSKNYQIIRLVSDLLTPLPRVRLERVETQIDFDEVRFDRKAQAFWLPVQVIVTVHWNGKILRNTHAYSDFKLFNVETLQKIAEPFKAKKAGEETDTPEKGIVDPSPQSVPPSK